MIGRKIHAHLVHNTTKEAQEKNEERSNEERNEDRNEANEEREWMPVVCEDVSAYPPYMSSYFL